MSKFRCNLCLKKFNEEIKLLLHFERRHVPQEVICEDYRDDNSEILESVEEGEREEDEDKWLSELEEEDMMEQVELCLFNLFEEEMIKRGEGGCEDDDKENDKRFQMFVSKKEEEEWLDKLNEEAVEELLYGAPFLFHDKNYKDLKQKSDRTLRKEECLREQILAVFSGSGEGGEGELEEYGGGGSEGCGSGFNGFQENWGGPGGRRRRRRRQSVEESKPISYRCVFCSKIFNCRSLYHYHLNLHTGEKPYFCEICEEGFATPNYLTKHIRIHMNPGRFFCPICNKGFREAHLVKSHLRTHTKVKPYKCNECGKAYTQVGQRNRHMQKHVTGENKLTFNCEDCKKSFSTKASLTRHLKTVHNEQISLKCPGCDAEFPTRKMLTLHKRLLHPPPRKPNRNTRRLKSKFHLKQLELNEAHKTV